MLGSFGNVARVKELRNRLLFTAGLLAVYRFGVFIPTPGVNGDALLGFFQAQRGTAFGYFNLFSGGALEQFSIFALGIMPYITASIILQLMAVVFPSIERIKKEGQVGQQKLNQWTRYGTIVLSAFQGMGIAAFLESQRGPAGELIVLDPSWSFRIMTVITLTAGTAFIMWLGEQITENGVGNGISLIIAAGIIAALPSAVTSTFQLMQTGELSAFAVIIITVFMIGVIAAIVFLERGQRRIPIQYAKQVRGRKVYGGTSTHLPLKVNVAGVIPPIFASSLLMFPLTMASFMGQPDSDLVIWVQNAFNPTAIVYNVAYVVLIIFFCYFYTAVQFNPVDVADNLKRYGGYIPGIRPGKKTAEYIDRVLTRITLWGSLYVATVCVIPSFLIAYANVPFYFGGTGLLIVVGVAMDTMAQVESHLLTRNYDGFLGAKGSRVKGRRARY